LRPLLGMAWWLSLSLLFLIALLRATAVNFNELATAFSGTAQTDSHYKRLQRFFRDFEMDYARIAHTVVIDENRSLGCCHWPCWNGNLRVYFRNIPPMLGVVHQGLPLVWCLDKQVIQTRGVWLLFQQNLQYFPRTTNCSLLTGTGWQEWFAIYKQIHALPLHPYPRIAKLMTADLSLKVQTVLATYNPTAKSDTKGNFGTTGCTSPHYARWLLASCGTQSAPQSSDC